MAWRSRCAKASPRRSCTPPGSDVPTFAHLTFYRGASVRLRMPYAVCFFRLRLTRHPTLVTSDRGSAASLVSVALDPSLHAAAPPPGATCLCSALRHEARGDPFRITPQINHGPNSNFPVVAGVENAVWEDSAQAPVIIAVNFRMNTGRDPQALDVSAQATQKILTEPRRLGLVK